MSRHRSGCNTLKCAKFIRVCPSINRLAKMSRKTSNDRNNNLTTNKTSEDLKINMEFNSDFDPNKSKRSQNRTVFDGNGSYRHNGRDVCDCLDNFCCGCHYPCPKCKSPKCGNQCRRYRAEAYSSIYWESQKVTQHNTNLDMQGEKRK